MWGNNNKLAPFIWHFLKPYWFIAFIFILLAVLAGFWGPFNSIIIKHIINLLPEVKNGNIAILIWPAAFVVLNFIVFDNVTWRSIGYINYKYQAVIKNQILSESLKFILNGEHQYFQDNLSGRISNQLLALAEGIELILHRISLDFVRGTSLVIVSLITAYFVNIKFFYILLFWFIAFATVSITMSKRLVLLADNNASAESVVSGQIVDCISNNSNVRIFARKDFEIFRMKQFFSLSQKTFQSKEWFSVLMSCIQGLLIAIMMALVAYSLVYLYGKGLVSIGDFALMFGISMELGHMMWYTMSQVDEFNKALGRCKQSLSALIVQPEIKDHKDAQELKVKNGEITFAEVQFHYPGTEPLFQKKSVVITAGQKVGLVGYSGGGKSTFVNLILRLFDVTDGRILIDGQDIRDVKQESLRRHIGLIPQDPFLFHRSLVDNIRYGKIDATDQEVIMAAKKAHAHNFIVDLPQGYDSLVGERGVKLSGGQRQRVAIARAFLKNAPILILDEATSQLDSITEKYIQESLWDLMQNKTTLVIAHRLSTLLHMDRILVFDKGRIVEDGTHQELLAKGGLYSELWKSQVGGFLLDENDVES